MEKNNSNSDSNSESLTHLTKEEKEKYNRQIILDEIGEEGQLKIKNSKVFIVGAGGLGSSCIMHLGGAGVGKLCIIDNDIVNIQNLHRQIIHNINTIGMNKALSAKKFLNFLNPNVEVVALSKSFTNKDSSLIEIIKEFDILIDCCDNPKTRYFCNDIAVLLNKPLISAASIRWDGQIGLYVKNPNNEKLPCYRCLNPNAPNPKGVKKCSQVGVVGTMPCIIGSLEANEAIKYILGKNDQILQRKILIFDGYDNKIKVIKTRNFRDDCVVCGNNPCINLNNINDYDYDKFINNEI